MLPVLSFLPTTSTKKKRHLTRLTYPKQHRLSTNSSYKKQNPIIESQAPLPPPEEVMEQKEEGKIHHNGNKSKEKGQWNDGKWMQGKGCKSVN